MNDDFERRLSESLNAERTRNEARVETDLPRIKGTVMENIHSRKRFTMMAAAGAAAVALVAGAISVPRLVGDSGPDPAPPAGESPSPEPTLDESVTVDETEVSSGDCSDLPFQPTYLPEGFTYGFRPGDGGQVAVPLGEQNPQAYGHWRGGEDSGFINVYEQDAYYQLSPDAEKLQIFDQWSGFSGDETTLARFGSVEDGYSLEFSANGCKYSAMGFGVSELNMRAFAAGLMQTFGNGVDKKEFAIYPEIDPAVAADACTDAPAWRRDPRAMLERFAVERLDIEASGVVVEDEDQGRTTATVTSEEGEEIAWVIAKDVGLRCWSVVAVTGDLDEENLSFHRKAFKWHFARLPAGTLHISMGFVGEETVEKTVTYTAASNGSKARLEIGYVPTTAGAWLLVFKDEQGNTISATGGTQVPVLS